MKPVLHVRWTEAIRRRFALSRLAIACLVSLFAPFADAAVRYPATIISGATTG